MTTSKIPGQEGKRVEYRTVDTSMVKGIEQAERLQRQGWLIARSGLFSIQFYKLAKGGK